MSRIGAKLHHASSITCIASLRACASSDARTELSMFPGSRALQGFACSDAVHARARRDVLEMMSMPMQQHIPDAGEERIRAMKRVAWRDEHALLVDSVVMRV